MLNLTFVCKGCQSGDHSDCRGGTWCACQHRPIAPPPGR